MLDKLFSAWRARHVLIIGEADGASAWMQTFLEELGAHVLRLPANPGAEALCRTMTAQRIAAVIVPAAHRLCPDADLLFQLSALQTLLCEAREAGVPLCILCSDENVYRARHCPWHVREDSPLGGQTREGLVQSILQLYADGVSRGLLGDAVRVLCVRHMPYLGGGDPSVAQYTRWCRALLNGEVVQVDHPTRSGFFQHPLDVVCGVLMLGARALSEDAPDGGIFNLGASPACVCPNRSAARRLNDRFGGMRPIAEREPPLSPSAPLLDDSRAQQWIGRTGILTADEALSMHMEWERAKRQGDPAALQRTQTRDYLIRML